MTRRLTRAQTRIDAAFAALGWGCIVAEWTYPDEVDDPLRDGYWYCYASAPPGAGDQSLHSAQLNAGNLTELLRLIEELGQAPPSWEKPCPTCGGTVWVDDPEDERECISCIVAGFRPGAWLLSQIGAG